MSTTHSAGKIGCVENVSIEKNICPFNFFPLTTNKLKKRWRSTTWEKQSFLFQWKKMRKKRSNESLAHILFSFLLYLFSKVPLRNYNRQLVFSYFIYIICNCRMNKPKMILNRFAHVYEWMVLISFSVYISLLWFIFTKKSRVNILLCFYPFNKVLNISDFIWELLDVFWMFL
jgi:hypothetical protein